MAQSQVQNKKKSKLKNYAFEGSDAPIRQYT